MEKINTLIWDELVNLPTPNPEAELRGFLETLPHSFRGTDVLLSCPKLVIKRKLLKLWRELKEGVFNTTITPSNGAHFAFRGFPDGPIRLILPFGISPTA